MARYIGDTLDVIPNINIEPARIGEVTHYVANIGKAYAILGYRPETSLQDGISKAVAWSLDWMPA